MSAIEPYGMTNQLDDTVLQATVTCLEARSNHPFFARMGIVDACCCGLDVHAKR